MRVKVERGFWMPSRRPSRMCKSHFFVSGLYLFPGSTQRRKEHSHKEFSID